MANFGDIREILQRGASQETWEALASGLQDWYGQEPLAVVLEYCTSHISHWPEDLPTFAPTAWFKRPPRTVSRDPITKFFVHASTRRTSYFVDHARAELAKHKALKPPKFISLDDLGEMRWRDKTKLDEKDRKRLIAWLKKSAMQLHDPELERLRQLLDDTDCQRWSKVILQAWRDDGEKSPHRWALMLVSYFGKEDDLKFSTSTLTSMSSSGKSARARQYLEIAAAFRSRSAYTKLADVALNAPLHYSVRHSATWELSRASSDASLDPVEFVARKTNYYEPIYKKIDKLSGSKLGEVFEDAMIRQVELPAWRLKQKLFADSERAGALVSTLFQVDDRYFRCTPDGLLDAKGASFELLDGDFVRVAHPAGMPDEALGDWKKLIVDTGTLPLFDQLDREVIGLATPLVPRGGIEVADSSFFYNTRFSVGDEVGAGYAHSIRFVPEDQTWYVELDLNYGVHVGTGDIEVWESSALITGISIDSKIGGSSASTDPVIYSEASLLCRSAIQAAQRPEG